MRPVPLLTGLLLICAGLFGVTTTSRSSNTHKLTIATWNLEWLVSPETALAARIACRDGGRALLPCDVALGLARDSADLGRMAAHASRLDADVIALQEVEDTAIASKVLRGYNFCLANGQGVQHVGFAIRRDLRYRCGPQLASLAAGGRGRPGMLLTLLLPGQAPIQLLAVHLKSGCAHEPLDAATAACRLLAAQAEALGTWISTQASKGRFIVLGDLNRGGLPDEDDAFWSLLHPQAFQAAASSLPFSNCAFGDPYTDYIDHILVGQALVPRLHEPAFAHLPYSAADVATYRLSDHCPVSVSLNSHGDL